MKRQKTTIEAFEELNEAIINLLRTLGIEKMVVWLSKILEKIKWNTK